ncbi:MAG: AAA family ATPase [Prevotella sp.]|nr:AAA family ATPase [Prevotella sp.]
MGNNISAAELFEAIHGLLASIAAADSDSHVPTDAVKTIHELLILTCHEGIRDTSLAFGNLFSQVDYLCNHHHLSTTDKRAIQEMRHHSNHPEQPLSVQLFLYDIRALCVFISKVFQTDIPKDILPLIPKENRHHDTNKIVSYDYLRCIVQQYDETTITAEVEQGEVSGEITIDYQAPHLQHLQPLLRKGMQINILEGKSDGEKVFPNYIILEPDFLVDISSVAACFKEYGHHPLQYLLGRITPRANTYATLLGNFAGKALDDIINLRHLTLADTLKSFFSTNALEFCTCEGFDGERFKKDAYVQSANIRGVVEQLFGDEKSDFTVDHAILEPSFVCEQLGLQGRVDLMTTDFKLLVEQKSGRNINIERQRPNIYGSYQLEPHFVQLLLYYGVLRQNFHLKGQAVDTRLLYSKYSPNEGLVVVAFYQRLFQEALSLRNQIVAQELSVADDGMEEALGRLHPDTLNTNGKQDRFYLEYLHPQIECVTSILHQLNPLEKAYFTTMMTFVYREQRVSKLGLHEGVTTCFADLWNMPLNEKIETGNILMGLRVTDRQCSSMANGYDTITLSIHTEELSDDFLPNFRRGDQIYLYAYPKNSVPDVREHILFKGNIKELYSDRVVVVLGNGQQNPHLLMPGKEEFYAIEHAGSDTTVSNSVRGMYAFLNASSEKRQLLLAQRVPQADDSKQLSHAYHPAYDEILRGVKQARDYYLLVGPPGTGKTSLALRYMVEECRADGQHLLLMAYTNRAVDEICAMLTEAQIPFIRIGHSYSCDQRFHPYLLKEVVKDHPRLETIRQLLIDTQVIVGTTSVFQSRPFLFRLKKIDVAIIDEASQILEPNLVGLLVNVEKFVLIGDYKQLPAVVVQRPEDSVVSDPLLQEIGLTDCRNSLFERLIKVERKAGRQSFVGVLRRQGRMHPDIAEFPNKMFYAREKLMPVPLPHQEDASVAHRVLFFPSPFNKAEGHGSQVNIAEAKIVCEQLIQVYQNYGSSFDPVKTVGVIVPYRNQIAVIRREIESSGIDVLMQVSIDTVERFQGSQRDVIIYSFTIQKRYQLEFLTANSFVEDDKIIDRKLNVVLTRARKQMIITGNEEVLRFNRLYAQLLDDIKKRGGYVV